MTEKIFNYPDNTFGFVSEENLEVNDNVLIGERQIKHRWFPVHGVVTEILEQRPERGTYTDESKRRVWQRIKAKEAV